MSPGQQSLRAILASYGITPTHLAREAGLKTHTTVTRFVGNPARGTPIRRESIEGETALRIYEALGRLGVPLSTAAEFLEASGHAELLERLQQRPPELIVETGEQSAAAGTADGSIDHLLATSVRLSQRGQREQALALARQAQHLAEGDPERWADITLRYCAHYLQQMGEVGRALTEVFSVKKGYLSIVEHPHPGIRALFLAQRGWPEDQQRGNFDAAHTLFTQALRFAEEAGDTYLAGQCRHFLVRIAAERAQTATGSWLGAWPTSGKRFPPELRQAVEQSLARDLPAAERLDPGNIHHHNRRFIAQALVDPRGATTALRAEERLYWQHSEHLLALNEARRDVSEAERDWEAWDAAVAEASIAFEGYCRQRLPQGIAQAAAVWSFAQRKRGVKASERAAVLDRWVLVFLLHPYETHPLFKAARAELVAAFSSTDESDHNFQRRYLAALNERVWGREGVFAALDSIDIAVEPWPGDRLAEMLGPAVMMRFRRQS